MNERVRRLNLAAGIRFPGDISPFFELRAVFSDADQIVLFGRTGFFCFPVVDGIRLGRPARPA